MIDNDRNGLGCTPDTVLEVARLHTARFIGMRVDEMPADKGFEFLDWLEAQSGEPIFVFPEKIDQAIRWVEANRETYTEMLRVFDAAVLYINHGDDDIDSTVYTNLAEFRRLRAEDASPLPPLVDGTPHDPVKVQAAIFDSAMRLLWGETIRPEDEDYYGYQLYVTTDQGMAAASLLDLYENYARTLGLYPEATERGALIAGAITEALHILDPKSDLFQILRSKEDGWIYGYDGFSPEFQDLVYGNEVEPINGPHEFIIEAGVDYIYPSEVYQAIRAKLHEAGVDPESVVLSGYDAETSGASGVEEIHAFTLEESDYATSESELTPVDYALTDEFGHANKQPVIACFDVTKLERSDNTPWQYGAKDGQNLEDAIVAYFYLS